MRSLYVLYGIAIENSFKLETHYRGICNLIEGLRAGKLITQEEYCKLLFHFKSNHPKKNIKFSLFTSHNSFHDDGVWWWSVTEEGNKQRILFLKALQQSVKPWYLKLSDKIWWI